MTFIVGQRWVSHSEAQLGLGVVTEVAGRLVTITFPAAEEERTYAQDNAPLGRVAYREGDSIDTRNGQTIAIDRVDEQGGLLFYSGSNGDGEGLTVSELELADDLILTSPRQRLFSGQYDKNRHYKLRIRTLQEQARLGASEVRGLLGSRTSLLPHQVYIAQQVAQRQAPRVLLADEVGLGKTIEAGMIVHQQLITGRASRVLIVVPNTLVHQWLVEMLRRFNLHFSIFNEDRLAGYDEEQNPFEAEQLVLCSLDLFTKGGDALQQALATHWDLLVVDEAHHLHWSEGQSSVEYDAVEALASRSQGLLLLTATPEQVGVASHFARLRLLDPSRYYDLQAFIEEEDGYQPLNKLVQQLMAGDDALDEQMRGQLEAYLGEVSPQADKHALVKQLLDRHGTGRVLLRNTRAAVSGFPERVLHPYPLPCPELYNGTSGESALYPELQANPEQWISEDPRVAWLESFLKQIRPEKVLVICANASTATALEEYLHLRAGIRSAAFFEGLSIIERDRAAAYFADTEQGAQALVCSEIGSEGRNFQFAHHLVLLDLPLNPDLLEQRIGRLDRIGQRDTIHIHVPYLEGSAQQTLFRWYHEGIGLFEQNCAGAYSIYEHFENELLTQLGSAGGELDSLLQQTAEFTDNIRQQLREGRDPLLELNSCRPDVAAELIEQIEETEDSAHLLDYMEAVLDQYGVDHEFHSENARILRPTDHMLTGYFPGLKDEGLTVTFDREQALLREDMHFLSWEHPIVTEAMEMIAASELGNATLATIKLKGIKPGTLLLEAVFVPHASAPAGLQLERFLDTTPIRILVDANGKDLSAVLSHQQLNDISDGVKQKTGPQVLKQIRDNVEGLIDTAEQSVKPGLARRIEEARSNVELALGEELGRLEALRKVNPGIRQQEIDAWQQQLADSQAALDRVQLALQGVRVIVTT